MKSKDRPWREPRKPRAKGKRPALMKNGHMESVRVGHFLIETGWNHEQRSFYVQTVKIRFPQPSPARTKVQFGPVFWHKKLTRCDERRDMLKRTLSVRVATEALGIELDD